LDYNKIDKKCLFFNKEVSIDGDIKTEYKSNEAKKKYSYIESLKLFIKSSINWISLILIIIKQFFIDTFINKLNKSKSKLRDNNNQETIDSVIAMAENENINDEVKNANVISVIVADKTIVNELMIDNPIKQEDLEAARKTVEIKLKEIEQREMTNSKPMLISESTNLFNNNIIIINNNLMIENNNNNSVPLPIAENDIKIIESFPDVVSEKTTDPTYMSQDYGPVDPYTSVDESVRQRIKRSRVDSSCSYKFPSCSDQWKTELVQKINKRN
jgi:hypothetical protein